MTERLVLGPMVLTTQPPHVKRTRVVLVMRLNRPGAHTVASVLARAALEATRSNGVTDGYAGRALLGIALGIEP